MSKTTHVLRLMASNGLRQMSYRNLTEPWGSSLDLHPFLSLNL